ncbi:hypothetical protein AMATHDRAFT_46960 [Amanita thiersii Skay4041]|uniref:Uncharacterized protein n=1 Tax=Amanita thiersii Skay4041 TaxID=703135 RepID=A0A2A9NQL9_9AGAR|nr:hypothetical protein AMATHDRAFT_46960 [Amanita thiersii Skay4041]
MDCADQRRKGRSDVQDLSHTQALPTEPTPHMAESQAVPDSDYKWVVVKVINATNLPLSKTLRRMPSAYVRLKFGPESLRTSIVSRSKSPFWDQQFPPETSAKTDVLGQPQILLHIFLIIHTMIMAGADITIPLEHGARFTVHFREMTLSEHAEDSMNKLEKVEEALTEASTQHGSLHLEQSSMAICQAVLKIGTYFAEFHPYAKFAWGILSFGFQMVLSQKTREDKVVRLIQRMKDMYDVVQTVQGIKVLPYVKEVINQILGLTVQFGYFLQDYSKNSTTGHVIKDVVSNIDDKIALMQDMLDQLHRGLDIRLNIQSITMLADISKKVDLAYLNTMLKPTSMETYNRDICHPETRKEWINYIQQWITDPLSKRNVLWIHGPAGIGKSTLSTRMADMFLRYGLLCAFIFFNRFEEKKGSPSILIRTLAYKLATYNSEAAMAISDALKTMPHIIEASHEIQFQRLLHWPLENVSWNLGHTVIVIDAFDECGTSKERSSLVKLLSTWFREMDSTIQVLLTSCSEPDLLYEFIEHPSVESYPLNPQDPDNLNDIVIYVQSKMEDIQKSNKDQLSSDWPGEESISKLVDLASGLFIWASTICSYIQGNEPDTRLKRILALKDTVVSLGSL